MPLFENVSYHVSQSISEETRAEISRILHFNGGVETSLKNATHIISNTIEFEGCDTLAQNVVCVTPYWVERSMELGSVQDSHFFSADKAQFFSGVVAAFADLPQGDKELISSGIEERGGSWRDGLTRDVTHLIVTNTNSEKYKVATHFRDSAHITIVLPHWFDKCWEMQMSIPTTLFEFPDPPFLKLKDDPTWYKGQLSNPKDTDYLQDGFDKKALFHVLAREPSFRERSPRDIWQGRRILLSASLELDDDRRKALEERIRSTCGLVLSGSPEDEGTIVDSADILITRYRSGPAYSRALDKGKTIGSLAWFLYVEKTGILSRPRDQLLHYPVRSEPIPGFEHHEITVTNYQGNARDYLKKLIQLMGATFTPTMSGKNTIVIAAYKSGTKTTKAEEWSVPVVHHKWLEDCFVEWRNLTPALKKYVDFAPGFNYGTLLGHRGVGHTGLAQQDKANNNAQVPDQGLAVVVKTSTTPVSPSKSPKRPQSSAPDAAKMAVTNSFRDALEVEEVEEVLSVEHLPDAPIKVGPPRSTPSPSKGVTKPLSTSNTAAGPSKAKASKPKVKKVPVVDEQREEKELEVKEEKEEKEEKVERPKKKRIAAKEMALSKSRRMSRPSSEPEQIDSDNSIQEMPLPSNKIGLSKNAQGFSTDSLGAKSVVRKKRKDTAKDSSDDDADEEDLPKALRSSSPHKSNSKSKSKSKSKSPAKPISARRQTSLTTAFSSDEDEVVTIQSPKAEAAKLPTKTKAKMKDLSEGRQSPSPPPPPPPPPKSKSKSPAKQTSVKRPLSPFAIDSSDSDVVETKKPKVVKTYKSPTKAKAKATRAASSPLSSPLSSPSSDEKNRPEAAGKTKKTASGHKVVAQQVVRPSSNRTVTVELPESDTLLKQQVVKKKPPAKPSTSSKDDSDQLTPSLSDHSVSVMSLLNNTLTSRRHAAAAATQKLRTQVMPDVINYENERKKTAALTRRRKSSLGAALSANTGDAEDSDASFRVVKKARTSVAAEESEDGRNHFVTHVKSSAKTVMDGDREGSGKKGRSLSKPRNGAVDKESGGSSSMDPKRIRIMTTKIDVPDDVDQALIKLGAKFTTKPSECTHLIASGMARTEKFLCALPQAPYVLSKDWLAACVKEKRVVAEKPFALRDPDVEHNHKFKLSEALQRANDLKKNKVKLLQGHTFYITSNVKVDHNMLINILKANGAEGKRATPNARNLSDSKHVHVLSCLKDEHLWRSLHKSGIPIYSQELVLSAAFKQFVDWDSPEMRVHAEAE